MYTDTWGIDIQKQFAGKPREFLAWGLCNRKELTIQFVAATTLLDIKELLKKIEKQGRVKRAEIGS